MKPARKAILRLVLCIVVVTAALAWHEDEPLLACAACINCDPPLHNSETHFAVCMPSSQDPYSTYCEWDCVFNPDGSGNLHPANIHCLPEACTINCYC
jgi:hypothetical protein